MALSRSKFHPLSSWIMPRQPNTTSSLHNHYSCFITTTSCSAPVPCIGTLTLVAFRYLSFSLNIKTTGSRSSLQKPKSDSRHFYAEHRLHSNQVSCRLILEMDAASSFDADSWCYDTSTVVQVYSSFWFLPAAFIATFPQCSRPLLFTRAAWGGLKLTPASQLRRAHLHLS